MVWGLIPIGSFPGAQTYYIFAKGTYKVGRKDCDIIIQSDRAISRLHAEIIVDTMFFDIPCESCDMSSIPKICVRDHSKFGTYINKERSSKAVHSYPNKEHNLNDGDVVFFGTGNACFRFCFINLTIFVGSAVNFEADTSLQNIMFSVGARTTHKWTQECTHVLSEESSEISSNHLDAIIEEKPVICGTWFNVLAEKNIRTEIPDCTLYAPTLMMKGAHVKLVDPKTREKCLQKYIFVVGSMHLYEFGDKMTSLLEALGAKVIEVDEFSKSIQNTVGVGENQIALVNPLKPVANFSKLSQHSSLPRVSEMELIIAAFSGHLEPSKLETPSILVSSSHSTDETIVADSQVEVDTATSGCITTAKSGAFVKLEAVDLTYHEKEVLHDNDSKKFTVLSSAIHGTGFTQRKYEDANPEVPESQNSDIIYSHDLIVKNAQALQSVKIVSDAQVINFKRFRKNAVDSGNSFSNFIPFAKDPYRESDFQSNDMASYMKEEKKRKQMEAISEDLFNSAKAKKKGSLGPSLLSFFSRS